jgi:methylmalonyl-CoA carboxyltransferase large subunit
MAKQLRTDLEAEVKELRLRIEKLEALLAAAAQKEQPQPVALPPIRSEIAPDILLAISAAVAAFLGKRATIHQIRLTGTTAWAMQGRATVQASHGIVRGYR